MTIDKIKNGFYIETNQSGKKILKFHYKNREIDLDCIHFYREEDGIFKTIDGKDYFLNFECYSKYFHINGSKDDTSYKVPTKMEEYDIYNYMINIGIVGKTIGIKSWIEDKFLEVFQTGYFFRENYTPEAINILGIYAYKSIDAWERAKRKMYFPSFARQANETQDYKYENWEFEFKYNEWTIAIIVNEDAIPTFIASNNNFVESKNEEIIFGSEAIKLVEQALEFGYFQVNKFDDRTIDLITEAVYGPNKKIYSLKRIY